MPVTRSGNHSLCCVRKTRDPRVVYCIVTKQTAKTTTTFHTIKKWFQFFFDSAARKTIEIVIIALCFCSLTQSFSCPRSLLWMNLNQFSFESENRCLWKCSRDNNWHFFTSLHAARSAKTLSTSSVYTHIKNSSKCNLNSIKESYRSPNRMLVNWKDFLRSILNHFNSGVV